jgi:NAD(P)-dependent dehydrogenase (short-subunit alcohol dehydrogenase family)
MRFKEKIVLITGGNSGIGKAAAIQFAKEGAKVMIADLSEKIGDDLVEEIEAAGGEASFIRVNVIDSDDVTRMVSETVLRMGGLDIIVNSAGVLGPKARTERYPMEDFDKVIDTNVKGVFYCMQEALKHFSEKKSGVIVNVASIAGILGVTGHIAYSASKHAVLGMTKTAAIEYARHNIRINAVCPGFTDTPMLTGADVDDSYLESLQQVTPQKRFGKPEEIATAICYLASDEASFVTGQGYVLDGGLSAQ